MGKETALPKNIRQIGDIQGKEKVYIEDYVMTYIRKKEPQEDKGFLGIFFGERKETESDTYVFIRGILELEQPEETNAENTVSPEEILKKQQADYFPGWEIQGTCVIGVYPTKRLAQLGEQLPEAARLIYHLQEQEETIYWKKEEQYQRLRGYFVFYEQNRKMQDYMADCFKDSSVEKESHPDHAIKSFREKVKEKNEQKNRSFLRLASSFFVVTLLIIGAVVVNRLDRFEDIEQYLQRMEGKPAVKSEIQQVAGSDAEESTAGINTAEKNTGISTKPVTETPQEVINSQDTINSQKTAAVQESASQTMITEVQEPAENTETQETQAAEASARNIQAAYVIKEGDTLAKICKKYYGDMDHLNEICEANEIPDADMIMIGQKIVLP